MPGAAKRAVDELCTARQQRETNLKLQSKAALACQKPLQCLPSCLTARLCSSPSAGQVSSIASSSSPANLSSFKIKHSQQNKVTCQDEVTPCTGKRRDRDSLQYTVHQGCTYMAPHMLVAMQQKPDAELLLLFHTSDCACAQLVHLTHHFANNS